MAPCVNLLCKPLPTWNLQVRAPAQSLWVKNLTSIHEDAGLIRGLAQCVKGSGIASSYRVGHRHSSDLVLLWLRHGGAAAALMQPLAQELPYATDAAIKRKKKLIKIKFGHRNKDQLIKNSKQSIVFYPCSQ